ncbi:class I adenylate-forming enzyme family protein [Sphingosinicella microcystinivorans]|uniref:ATP-dependent acyl-CoA ligase n=1 Tax=Sphingosinicella microcystinivorans TaxID=335406 RepID=A0AAD1D4R2_SPHMI|nr:AMP-binding protein [Sphingosinicella microcystinivorans]RKS85431.1 crotonobetaine/carnitine-CoA ligase [Sphingosinicella microcystinivorans]BBE33279.1 ATP-dependent acyl-CoA ligase [Sphingosinicella microcystinivorans]
MTERTAHAPLGDIHPFMAMDVPWLLDHQAGRYRDKPFMHWDPFEGEGYSWSYADLRHQVACLATGLVSAGVMPGDRVIVHMGNRPEFLLSFFACSWVGAIAVTTNIHSAPGELAYFAEHADARFAITEAALRDVIEASGAEFVWTMSVDDDAFRRLLANDPMERRAPEPDRFHSIMYTSGTTSRPKAVVFSHANMLWTASTNAVHEKITADDITLVYLPLFHLNALGYSTFATLWTGGTIVLQPRFSATRFWDTAKRFNLTWTSIGPFVTKALLDLPYPDRHSFRFWGNNWGHDGTIEKEWGIASLGWYGMTETISHPIISDIAKPPVLHSIGRPAPEYELRVVDENGETVKPGEMGRLYVRGVRGISLFCEYLNDPEATANAFTADGWFDTGDMIKLCEDGTLQFADRKKDMLKVGGENVAASEVESVILDVEGVAEVAVVGKPHDFLSEVPVAFVVATGGTEELTQRIEAHCVHHLAKFKRPVEIRYIDALPRLSIGKLDRKALRAGLTDAG